MKKKEIKALITLAGSIDPSLHQAMLQAQNASFKTASAVEKNFSRMGSNIKGMSMGLLKGMGRTIMALSAAAIVAFGAMGAVGLNYASDLREVQNVVDTTFGASSAAIDAFASTALEKYGLSELQAKQFSGTMGAMLKSMGLTSEETLVMSQNLTALSGDMSSFHNLSGEDAFAKIRAGISGETEPLKQLGINMSVANLEAYALAQGMGKSFSAMSQGEQTILRYNYLMEKTADAQGDFKDTELSFANQKRLFGINIQQASGEIMESLLPALAGGMYEMNEFITSLDTDAIGSFVGELGAMAIEFVPLVMEMLPQFGELLELIMPPLLEIGEMIMPIFAEVVGVLVDALAPVIPMFIELVQMILPPLASLFKTIAPLVSIVAQIFMSVFLPVIGKIIKGIQPLLDILAEIAGFFQDIFSSKTADFLKEKMGKLGNIFNTRGSEDLVAAGSGVDAKATATAAKGYSVGGMSRYAKGGFSDEAAIFGEEGLEAAIPIKPGNPRSLMLLQRTAEMLGVGEQYNTTRGDFIYSPVIHAGSEKEIEPILKRTAREMKDLYDDYMDSKGRLSWS